MLVLQPAARSLPLSLCEPPLRRCLLVLSPTSIPYISIYISSQKVQLNDTDCSR